MSSPIRPPLTVRESDGNPTGRPINTIVVTNGSLSVSGTTATISTGGGGGGTGTVTSIALEGSTGSTSAITTNGAFKIIGAGTTTTAATGTTVTITSNDQFDGTVTSVGLTETGSALTITGSPITGAGTFNIAGAGTSSQVILGDLSLGTLTSGTVTSITLTETGSALTITGSPVTTSGTINIAGAGTSSQVILGDLSLGTLTSGTVTGITSFAPLAVDNTNPAIPSLAMPQSNVGQNGWLSSTDWSTFNNKGSGTVTGTGSANQVSYWTAASVQAGSTGLTYDPSTGNLTVGGYVEVGTKVTTPTGTNLTLDTNDGTNSGSIVIADGANGQISITPNGTGTIKLDGVELDNTAIATGYVLKATSATAAGWASESGGGGTIGGSIASTQVARGSTTADEIEGDNGLLFDGTSLTVNTLSASDPIINMSSSTKSVSLEVNTSNKLSVKGGSDSFIFDASSGTGGITFPDGTTQITAASGGGGSDEANSLAAGMTNVNSELLGVGYNAPADGIPNPIQWANSLSRIRPHNMLQAGTLDNAYVWFSLAPTGASTQTFNIGLWNAGTDNKMGTLKAVATIEIIVGGSTGIQGGSWTAEAGEDLDVTLGGLYWVGFYGNYAAVGDAAGLYFLPQAGLNLFPSRRSNGSLTNTNNLTRVYASGSPSTIGDNPTIANGDSQFNATWPYMWYDLT